MERMARSVLVVDDSAAVPRHRRARCWRRAGYRGRRRRSADGGEALAAVEAMRPDAVLLDVNLPDADGIAVAGRLAGAAGPAVVLVSTLDAAAHAQRDRALAAPAASCPRPTSPRRG